MNACRTLLAAALAIVAVPAGASICYAVIDRNDATIYQSQRPPIDLSDPGAAGAAARNALRARGHLLLIFDSQRCVELIPATAAGKSFATVDEIVAGYKSTVGRPQTGGPNIIASGIYGVAGDGGGGYGNYGNYGNYGGYGGYGGYGDYGGWGGYRGWGGYEGGRDGLVGDRPGVGGGIGDGRGAVGGVGGVGGIGGGRVGGGGGGRR